MEPYNLINAQFINLSNQVAPIASLTIVDGKIYYDSQTNY